MKKPTLKQVKQHFENADTVKCLEDDLTYIYSENQLLNGNHWWFNWKNKRNIKIWDETFGYAKIITVKNNVRPVVNRMHTEGEWGSVENNEYIINLDNDVIARIGPGLDITERIANAKLIAAAPKLLQIAEMYFDSMKGTDKEGSIPFNITLETLKNLE